MPWTAQLIGVGSVLDSIDDIQLVLDENVVYVVGTNIEYAPYVEFGTSNMAAQPHFWPIVRQVEREIPSIAKRGDVETLGDAVQAVALEVERRLKATGSPVPVDTGTLKGSYEAREV